jgi:PAS domain S-box-containing protein
MLPNKGDRFNINPKDYRFELIQELLVELASGNLSYRSLTSEKGDDLDAIITGINMLGEELQTSTVDKEFLNTIFESIMDMVVVLDPELRVDTINQNFKDILGYTVEEIRTSHFKKLFDLTNVEFSSLINNLNIHRKIKNFETNFLSKNGNMIPVAVSLSKLIGKNGEEKGILIIAKEIGHLKRVETELKKRNEELNTFIYKLSHDLRGPLSSILGLTDIAGKELSSSNKINTKEAKYYNNLIRESAIKLDEIIRNLNEVIQLRQRKLAISSINLKNEVSKLIAKKFSTETNFSVFINIQDDLNINTDPSFLEVIIDHLVDNSFKFRNKKQLYPFCEITGSKMKSFTLIKIKDNGRGISQEHLEKIFIMFHRATADVLGSGLGLFIVKSIVDKIEGEIQVFSKIGEGTEFLIFIPN